MIKKYHKLFQLELMHTYFQEGKSRDLTVEPSPISVKLMQKLGLKWVPRPMGYEAFWSSEERGEEEEFSLAKLSDEPILLSFVIRSSNPFFLNYTDLSLEEDKRNQRYYFTNQAIPSGGEFSTSDPTQAEQDGKVVGDADLRQFGNSQQVIKFPPFDKEVSQVAILKNYKGDVISSGAIPSQQLEAGQYILNLAEEDWGYYDLLIADSAAAADGLSYSFYYMPDQMQQQAVGLIQMSIDPTALSLKADEQSPPAYKLSFARRYTKWRYILMNSNNLAFSDVRLKLNEQELAILKPTAEDLQREPNKYTISLQEARPLQEAYTESVKIDLLRAAEGADASAAPEVALSISLPSPDSQRIYPTRIDGKLAVYSDMFVYI